MDEPVPVPPQFEGLVRFWTNERDENILLDGTQPEEALRFIDNARVSKSISDSEMFIGEAIKIKLREVRVNADSGEVRLNVNIEGNELNGRHRLYIRVQTGSTARHHQPAELL